MERMSNIPEFYVTNRTFEDICSMVHLTEEDFLTLPEGAYVLEIGSGVFQNFAKKLKDIRPDVRAVSLDPTLGISAQDSKLFDVKVIKNEKNEVDTVMYLNKEVESNFIVPSAAKKEDLGKIQQQRVDEASKSGFAIAGLAPDLPFKDNSLDLIIDVYGPSLYVQLNQEKKITPFFKEIYRVLKSGGEMRIFPAIDMQKELKRRDLNDEISIEYSKIFFHQMFSMNKLAFDINFEEGTEPGTKRKMLVMILKKIENGK